MVLVASERFPIFYRASLRLASVRSSLRNQLSLGVVTTSTTTDELLMCIECMVLPAMDVHGLALSIS